MHRPPRSRFGGGWFAALLLGLFLPFGAQGQGILRATDPSWADDPPDPMSLVRFARAESEFRNVIGAYRQGNAAMLRRVSVALSGEPAEGRIPPPPNTPESRAMQREWYDSWLAALLDVDFDALSVEGKVDYILLRNRIEYEITMLDEGQVLIGSGEGPIGEEGLRAHLMREMIPYTAEELIAIGEKEFAWMDEALLDASRRMGYGDDWRTAQEMVKRAAVPPGEKPGLVRDIMYETERFIDSTGAVTMPSHMREIWRMGMRGPESQLITPFFTGGEQVTISYPTNEMSHDQKMMSMRGNNPHFNRATVHHELIPGHGHQGWMTQRFNPHRQLFSGPFWGEGWALYYEFVLWDQGFPRGPEDEIGMLFWRMHRAARIVFSMSYHLERMTAPEAVDYLVDRVGFERANAEAEVRRSFEGSYPPLYQLAYMIGGLQIQALRRELVETGRMTEREFHDTLLQGGRIPIEMVRLRLLGEGLTRDYTTSWRFYGDPLTDR